MYNENTAAERVFITALRFAAAEFTTDFMKFAGTIKIYSIKSKQREDYEGGIVSFRFAEMEDADKQTAEEKHKAAIISMRKLIDLNRKFKNAHHEYIILSRVDEEDYEDVLDEILYKLHV